MSAVRFELPPELEAAAPPEHRDEVRLMVARPGKVEHARFAEIGAHLRAGDLLVVNTSATIPAAVDGLRGSGAAVLVHFSSALGHGEWAVELRAGEWADGPLHDVGAGETVRLPDGVQLHLRAPYPDRRSRASRLWRAGVAVDGPVLGYLARHGRPIHYAYVGTRHPLSDYQTVFAAHPGSAEMPSAGRPFTTDVVADLARRGVLVAPILLHTGVSSPEAGEAPLPERYAVPETTARQVEFTRAHGGRVVAVGTTVTRALETAAGNDGTVRTSSGLTRLVLGPRRPARVVTGLITGWHAPGASHLQLLQAVAGRRLVQQAYTAAVHSRYHWHEFGDSCLLLPGRAAGLSAA